MLAKLKQLKHHFMSWLVVCSAALFVCYQYLLQASPSVMVPDLMSAFAINQLEVGVLTSSFFYSYIILQIPAGLLVDRYGAQWILAGMIVLCAVATILFASATTLFTAELSRVLMGIASAPAVACTLYLCTTWLPPKQFALAVGIIESVGMFGGGIGEHYLSVGVHSYLGWRSTLFICAAFGLLLAASVFFIVKDKPKHYEEHPADNDEHYLSLAKIFFGVISNKQAWIAGFYAGLTFAMLAGFGSLWCVPYLEHRYGIDVVAAAYGSSLMFIGASVGAPIVGWLANFFESKKLLFITFGLMGLFSSLIILFVPDLSLDAMYFWCFLLGFFVSIYVLSFAVVRENTPADARGTSMGFCNMLCIIVGAPILQPLMGWLIENAKAFHTPYFFGYQLALSPMPVCLCLAVILGFFIHEKSSQPKTVSYD